VIWEYLVLLEIWKRLLLWVLELCLFVYLFNFFFFNNPNLNMLLSLFYSEDTKHPKFWILMSFYFCYFYLFIFYTDINIQAITSPLVVCCMNCLRWAIHSQLKEMLFMINSIMFSSPLNYIYLFFFLFHGRPNITKFQIIHFQMI
jgi:hypothetical protein